MPVRQRVGAFFRKHFTQPADNPPSSSSAAPSPPSSTPISRLSTNHEQPVVQVRSHHAPSGNTVADRPASQSREQTRRRTRRRRRTSSPVGLPLYSKDPAEEEMSLFRSEVDLSMGAYDAREEDEEDLDLEDDGVSSDEDEVETDGEGGDVYDESLGPSARPSFDASSTGHSYRRGSTDRPSVLSTSQRTSSLVPPSFPGNRPRSASAPLASHLSPLGNSSSSGLVRYMSNSPGNSSPFTSRTGLIDLPDGGLELGSLPSPPPSSPSLSPRMSREGSNPPVSLNRYSNHRATHSSPSNTLTLPSPSSSPTTSTHLGIGRPRSSTLQRILGRNSSNSSLNLSASEVGRSPYGQYPGGANSSTTRLASSSTASISRASISAPLPDSFVHSSFVFPRSGPTPQQVVFISSRESLGAYGYGAGVGSDFASPPTFLAATSTTSLALPSDPNTLARPQNRVRSGSSASRMSSSPLARVATLTPPSTPPPEQREQPPRPIARPMAPPLSASAHAFSIQRETAEDEEVKTPAASSSAPKTTDPSTVVPTEEYTPTRRPSLAHSLTLNISDLPTLPTFGTPPSGGLTPATLAAPAPLPSITRQPTSPPPRIFTLAPTPTASAAPSPRLPQTPSATDGEGVPNYFHFPTTTSTTPSTPPVPSSAAVHGDGSSWQPPPGARRTREMQISTISEASFLSNGSWNTAPMSESVTASMGSTGSGGGREGELETERGAVASPESERSGMGWGVYEEERAE